MATHQNPQSDGALLLKLRRARRPLLLVGLAISVLLAANAVSAWGRRGEPGLDYIKSHVEHVLDGALDRLDATDDQSAAIRVIVMATIDDLQAARGDREQGREQLRNLVTGDSVDRAAIETFRRSHLERADQMSRIVAESVADVMEILTPEQRRQIEAHFAEGHGHRRHGWGWH